MSPEQLAKKWYDKREERLALARKVRKLEDDEREFKRQFIETCLENEMEGAVADGRAFSVVTKRKVAMADFNAFCQFCVENDAFELFTRRVNETALKEYQEAGTEVAGLDYFELNDVSTRKVS